MRFSSAAYFSFLLLLITCFAPSTFGQGTVSGTVTDAATGETLIGVNVRPQEDGNLGAATDLDGRFTIRLEGAARVITIEASYVGYETAELEINYSPGDNIELSFAMQEKSTLMDQLVVTGSRFEKRLSEETVSMEIIRPEGLERINAVRIDDAISRVSGVNVIDGQLNIRGGAGYSYGAGTRVLLLYDDMPILQADAGFPNWTTIPHENVGQIELIKGASSALYGSSAINGIVNLRSAEPTNEPYLKISAFGTAFNNPAGPLEDSVGNGVKNWWTDPAIFDTLHFDPDVYTTEQMDSILPHEAPHEAGLNFAYRKKFGDFDLTAGGSFLKSESYMWGEYDDRGRVNFRLRYRVKPGLTLGLAANTQYGVSGSFFLWNGLGSQVYNSWTAIGVPTATKGFRLTIDPSVRFWDKHGNKHNFLLRYNQVDNDNTNDQNNFSKYYYGEYQYQRAFESIGLNLSSGVVGNYVTVKADLYTDDVLVSKEERDTMFFFNDDIASYNLAGYLQLDKKFFNKLNLSAGMRVENNRLIVNDTLGNRITEESLINPEVKSVFRLGANYELAEYTFLRASWGQGYRFPTIAEKFISTEIGSNLIQIADNPTLRSETGWTAELGIKQGYAIKKFKGLVDLALFYQEYQDMMEFTFTQDVGILGGFQSQNIGDTRISGFEVVVGGEGPLLGRTTSFNLGYTYIQPEYQDFTDEVNARTTCDENILTYRNRHTVKGSFDMDATKDGRYSFGATMQYYSHMECIDQIFEVLIPGLAEYREINNKGNFVLDLRAGVRASDQITVTAVVRNAMNREYSIRPGLMEPPRTYTLRVDFTL